MSNAGIHSKSEPFPIKIPESQGDLVDQAQEQIEASIQEQIDLIRQRAAKEKQKNTQPNSSPTEST